VTSRPVPAPLVVVPAGAGNLARGDTAARPVASTAAPTACDPPPLPGLADAASKTFAAPWEARAFAIVVSLAEAGRFTWAEWVATFSREVAAAEAAAARGEVPRSYYEQWLDAIEKLAIDKGFASTDQLQLRRFAFTGGAVALLRTRDTDTLPG
jgi:nitrile hydratase accessory protein